MIFQHTYRLILDGRKTQTRRMLRGSKPPCRVGQSIAVQPGRAMKAVGRVLVTDVQCSRLGAMTDTDARMEGFPSLLEFRATWEAMHGDWNPDAAVWVITFQPLQERYDE